MTKILFQNTAMILLLLYALKLVVTLAERNKLEFKERITLSLVEWSKGVAGFWLGISFMTIISTWSQVIVYYRGNSDELMFGVATIVMWIWSLAISLLSPGLIGLRKMKWLFASLCMIVVSSFIVLAFL